MSEDSEPVYTNSSDPNALIIVSGSKRKDTNGGPVPKKKDPTGRKKGRNFAAEKEKARMTKKMKRQLEAVKRRKAVKLTQEELFASLAQYQLDPKKSQGLQSSSQMNDKHSSRNEDTVFPTKLRAISGKQMAKNAIHQKERKQEHYYPTDSESSDAEDDNGEDSNEDGISSTAAPEKSAPVHATAAEIADVSLPSSSGFSDARMDDLDEIIVRKRNKKEKITVIQREDIDEDDDKKSPSTIVSSSSVIVTPTPKDRKEDISLPFRTKMIINRDPKVQEQRYKLPICAEEIPIVEAIDENIVTIVCGETGSGKTTQIPQFLLESGYASNGMLIGITEPRRVAAISMAKRVGEELGMAEEVSYQIRYEGNRSDKTKILFMTDGVLMKEMETDIMLKKYSAILIDEAHERSMYSDVLIGMLSRIAPLRAKTKNPLKLVIMSATLRLQDFLHKRLFPSIIPKQIKVDARQFPVTVHFEKRTPDDYLTAAFRKTCRIHECLPDGGILVFVSGQNEVRQLIQKLTDRYPIVYETTKNGEKLLRGSKKWAEKRLEQAKNLKLEDFVDDPMPKKENDLENVDGEDLLESGVGGDVWDDYENEFADGDSADAQMPPPPKDSRPLYCLPLYSLLSSEKQQRIFADPPEGTRMCVISTNVAETSLTIPGVRYVVDTGYEKRRLYDPITGVSQFVVAKVSQASADQRAGRAGRVGPGHAYRLYSSAVFQDFVKFSRPEIMDKPADQLVLHLKSMNIVKVVNFPFPSAPESDVLQAAEERLVKMGALASSSRNGKTEARITTLGKTLSVFPLSPAYAKVIAMANQHQLMEFAIALISILSVREPLVSIASLRGTSDEETKALMTDILKLRRSWCGKGPSRRLGDLMVLLRAIAASEEVNMSIEGCSKYGLRRKAMTEVNRLRKQLTNIVNTSFKPTEKARNDYCLTDMSEVQAQMLRQIMVAALPDRIARRVDRSVTEDEIPRGAYQTMKLKEYVFIDPCSMIFTEEPDYILYQDIVQIGDRKCMQTLMTVDFEWLSKLAEPYCVFGEMDKDAEPTYSPEKDDIVQNVTVRFGPLLWTLPNVDRPIPRDIMLYRHFAKFFLDGTILPMLAEYVPKMLAPPTTMVRSWAKLQRRTEILLNALVMKEVHSKAALIDQFHANENYLLEQYLEWIPESLHSTVTLMWPPLEQKSSKMGRNKIYTR